MRLPDADASEGSLYRLPDTDEAVDRAGDNAGEAGRDEDNKIMCQRTTEKTGWRDRAEFAERRRRDVLRRGALEDRLRPHLVPTTTEQRTVPMTEVSSLH